MTDVEVDQAEAQLVEDMTGLAEQLEDLALLVRFHNALIDHGLGLLLPEPLDDDYWRSRLAAARCFDAAAARLQAVIDRTGR